MFVRNLILMALTCVWISLAQGQLAQPVLDRDFPDPAIVHAEDGWYYTYATQTITQTPPYQLINIQMAKSRDLKSWIYLGDALPVKPRWAQTTQSFWAPDVHLHEGTYYMYFSALQDSLEGFCIGMATSENPEGPFEDSGEPVICGDSYTTIDPMAFDDPETGEKLLYWGSGFEPIKVQALDEDRRHFKKGTSPLALLTPVQSEDPNEYRRLLEGSWMHFHDGYYYLFFSGDNCCIPPHYAVMVARSRNATGPFEFPSDNWRDSIVVEADKKFSGPGHNSVIEDSEGRTWILFHAVDRNHPKSEIKVPGEPDIRRVMIVQELEWDHGWPRLKPDVSDSELRLPAHPAHLQQF